MSLVFDSFRKNRILAGLSLPERRIVERLAESSRIHLGDILDRPGEAVRYVHFPVDAAISMMDMKDSAHSVDVALIGAEGCSGASIVQGSDTSPCLNIVQIGGSTVRIRAPSLAEHLPKLPYMSAVLPRYNLLLMRHIVISVGCCQFHSPEQRTARWLVAHSHRAGLTIFPFTSDFLAAQVGITRQHARGILDEMQRKGLISKSPKNISVCDLEALAQQSCACFELTKEATDSYVEALTRLSRAYGTE